MEIWDVVTVIFYLFTTNEVALCHVINADSLVTMDTQLEGFHFWSSRVSGLDSCAKACMRTKMCVSFNFQLDAKLCYLNFDNVSNHQDATITRNRALYSDIAVWPPEVMFHDVCVFYSITNNIFRANELHKL